MPHVMKSGSLNILEPSRPVQTCTGIALPFKAEHRQQLEKTWAEHRWQCRITEAVLRKQY